MNIPAITGEKLVNCLVKKFGFVVVRQKGSHISLRHADGRAVTIPCHQGKDFSKGLLIKIIKREVKIPVAEVIRMLQLLVLILNQSS